MVVDLQPSRVWRRQCVTLRHNAHVRVDVLYGRLGRRARAWINLAGTALFLVPFCLFLLWSSWDYVSISWQIREASQEAGGLPYPFMPLMKSCIPLTALLLMGQGLVLIIRNALLVSTRLEDV